MLRAFTVFITIIALVRPNILHSIDSSTALEQSLDCFQKYWAFKFGTMGKARFHLIRSSHLRQTDLERLFLQKSNELFYNPMSLATAIDADDKLPQNYVIFLASQDFEVWRHYVVPKADDTSFLYVFCEQIGVNVSIADIYSIFTPRFDQNIVIITVSVSSSVTESVEWISYRLTERKCIRNSNLTRQYETQRESECRGSDHVRVFPTMPSYNHSCPLQVMGVTSPPFLYLHMKEPRGIDYDLVRLIANRLQVLINLTRLNAEMYRQLYKQILMLNSTISIKQSVLR